MLQIYKKDQLNDEDITQWNQLWEKEESASYWNSFCWYNACKQTAYPDIEVWFVYQDSELIAILPLEPKRYKLVNCLVTFGQPFTDKSTILINKNNSKLIPEIIKKLGVSKPVILTEIEQSQCAELLSDVLHEESAACLYLDFTMDFEKQVAMKMWRQFDRKVKKSTYTYTVYHGNDAQPYIDVLWDIEQLSNKAKLGRLHFFNDTIKELYRKATAGPDTMLTILYDGEKTFAYELGFLTKGKYYIGHIWAYDDEYKKIGPGRFILNWLLQYLKDHNCVKYDFSRGESIIKSDHAIYSEKNYTLYYNAKNLTLLWFKLRVRLMERYLLSKNKDGSLYKIWTKLKEFKRSFEKTNKEGNSK